MREAHSQERPELTPDRGSFCLTSLSTAALVGFACAMSGLLWLCIWAVL